MTSWILFGMAILTVIDVQKINASRSENVVGDKEKCIKETIMAPRMEELCLREETDEQPGDFNTCNGKAHFYIFFFLI